VKTNSLPFLLTLYHEVQFFTAVQIKIMKLISHEPPKM